MRVLTLRWIDVAAALTWMLCVSAALSTTAGANELRPWVPIFAAVGAVLTAIAWLSRRFEELETRVYTEGVRAGIAGRGVVRLDDHERLP